MLKNNEGILINKKINRDYLTGFTGSSGLFLLTKEDSWLISDFRYQEELKQDFSWLKSICAPAAVSLWDQVIRQCKNLELKKLFFESAALTHNYFTYLTKNLSEVTLLPKVALVEELRMIKDVAEIMLLSKAAQIADNIFKELLPFIKPGISERRIAHIIEELSRKHDAEGIAFPSIVASGVNSARPHARPCVKELQYGELVTIDFGVVYRGYCSDITRTIVLGQPNKEQAAIYNIVLTAQKKVLEFLKPGITAGQVDCIARDYITAAGYGNYFGHSTGHGIGLEIHEAPVLARKASVMLKPGMVVTIEPGIYIPAVGGVRIEDDVLITETGCRLLTKSDKNLLCL
jgi:Xaa-Pro aminopeptidase